MNDDVTVVTNGRPRPVTYDYELDARERAMFDHLDWDAIERGEDSALFVRYRGDLLALSEFSAFTGLNRDASLPDPLAGWAGYLSESMFSALVIRFTDDTFEHVVVGRVLS